METEEIFENAPLDFDPAYPPMDKWTRSHPQEQILGDPQAGVLTRPELGVKNEVLNAIKSFVCSMCLFRNRTKVSKGCYG